MSLQHPVSDLTLLSGVAFPATSRSLGGSSRPTLILDGTSLATSQSVPSCWIDQPARLMAQDLFIIYSACSTHPPGHCAQCSVCHGSAALRSYSLLVGRSWRPGPPRECRCSSIGQLIGRLTLTDLLQLRVVEVISVAVYHRRAVVGSTCPHWSQSWRPPYPAARLAVWICLFQIYSSLGNCVSQISSASLNSVQKGGHLFMPTFLWPS